VIEVVWALVGALVLALAVIGYVVKQVAGTARGERAAADRLRAELTAAHAAEERARAELAEMRQRIGHEVSEIMRGLWAFCDDYSTLGLLLRRELGGWGLRPQRADEAAVETGPSASAARALRGRDDGPPPADFPDGCIAYALRQAAEAGSRLSAEEREGLRKRVEAAEDARREALDRTRGQTATAGDGIPPTHRSNREPAREALDQTLPSAPSGAVATRAPLSVAVEEAGAGRQP
jgi:hypothetical protein